MSATYKSSHYQAIESVQLSHFWFRARNELLQSVIHHFFPHVNGMRFLEVGFGTGIVLPVLERLGFVVCGIDINFEAVRRARSLTHAVLVRSSLLSYEPRYPFDAIGIFDVLEHQKNDIKFLFHCRRVIKKDGLIFITVPASPRLWSTLDQQAGHQRRYTKEDLFQKLQKAHFSIEFYNYWQFLTLPLYILQRSMLSRKKGIPGYLAIPPRLLNILLFHLLRIEAKGIFTIGYPIGGTLIVCAKAT